MSLSVKHVSKQLSRSAVSLSEGLFAHAVDFTLWLTVYVAEMGLPQSANGLAWRAGNAADAFLNKVNYQVIKNALGTARKRGLVKKSRKRRALPEITQEGRKRLAAILPCYDEERIWDGKLYIVTYDIPEKRKKDRDLLRKFLRRIGCGRLQDSVWITPYNPIDVTRSFIEDHRLKGTIIISDIGKDGSVGEEDIHDLVTKVYKLEELDSRYTEWMKEVENIEKIDVWTLTSYLSILQDDPQLPFFLLPRWWNGDRAYKKVKNQLFKLSFFTRPRENRPLRR